MRTAVSELDLVRAASLDDALAILRDDARVPVAGATDLYVSFNAGTLARSRFLDIWGLDELREITEQDGRLVIGSLVSYTALIRSPVVARQLPMLVQAAKLVGGVQIQNRGTLGGNIANGSPAADGVPVLAAVDAVLLLRSAAGVRRVPMNGFYTGYRASVLRPDELIVAIEIEPVAGTQWFRKVGTRAAQAISKVVMAAVRAPVPKIALGSVAPTVIRVPQTEHALASGASIDEAADILAREVAPIDDIRSSAGYRRRVSGNLLRRFWAETG